MANQVNRQISIYVSTGEAQKAFDRLIEKEKDLKAQLDKATDPAIIKRLNAELAKLQEPISRAAKKLSGELLPSTNELKRVLADLQRQLNNTDQGTAEFNRLKIAVQKAKIELSEAKARAEELNDKLSGKLGEGIKSFLTGFGIAFGTEFFQGLFRGIKDFFSDSLDEAEEATRTVNAMRQALEASARTDAFDRLIDKAQDMADKFQFLDNDDVTGVFTKLIDYGKLTEKQVNDLIPLIIDLYGKEQLLGNAGYTLADAADLVIKGLSGQGKELKKYGINIKDGGDLTERLSIIMDQLGAKVRGAADAFGTEFHGKMKIAEQDIKDQKEEIGNSLLPVWYQIRIKALEYVNDTISLIRKLKSEILEFAALFKGNNAWRQFVEDRFWNEELPAQSKASAKSFVNDAMSKTIEEQKVILRQQQAILDSDEKRYALLVLANSQWSQEGRQQQINLSRSREIVAQLKSAMSVNADTRKLGIGIPDEEKEKKKIENLFESFRRQMMQQAEELEVFNAAQVDKDLAASKIKYDKQHQELDTALKKQQLTIDQYGELVLANEENRYRERDGIIQKWVKESSDKQLKLEKEKNEKAQKLEEKRMEELLKFHQTLAKNAAEVADRSLGGMKFGKEVDIMIAKGRERLQARLDLLKLEEQAEIASAEKSGKSVNDITRKYQFERKEIMLKTMQGQIGAFLEVANQMAGMLQQVFAQQAEAENERLERDRRNNEKQKDNFRRQLDGKAISQKEYDRKVAALDKQMEERERAVKLKQFQREKALSLVQASINIAKAITAVLANPFQVALVAALGAIQLGLIARQQPPKLAKGGKIVGPSHSEMGLPIIDPKSGKKVAEIEGGEVILSKKTVRNNPSIVDQLLFNSLYREGAPITPTWKNVPIKRLNLPAIERSIETVRWYETGGVFQGVATSNNNMNTEVLERLTAVTAELNYQLSKGIIAITLLSQHERQVERMDTIKAEATIK